MLSRSSRDEVRGLGEVSTPQLWATIQRCHETHPSWESSPFMAECVLCVSVPVNLTTHPLQTERDFFGRVVIRRAAALSAGVCEGGSCGGRGWVGQRINPVAPTEDTAPETDAVEQRMGTAVGRSDVWFRFKEGVSNAVRRSLHIRDLL